jgi:2-polyprenyl-3-methyl-5-hydroxy-6-metoxy-1,4-benzoquinol methylase
MPKQLPPNINNFLGAAMKADYLVHDRLYQEARAKGWDGWGGNDRLAYEHQWIEHLFAYGEIPKTGEVLELGCGEGHLARLLAEKGYSVLGVDISPTALTSRNPASYRERPLT